MPARRVVRRRRGAVLAAAAVALVGGAALGARHEPPAPVTRAARPSAPEVRPVTTPVPSPAAPAAATPAVGRLSLQRQVGKLVVLRFQGTAVPLYVKRVLRHGWAAGAILFRGNIAGPAQLRTLTRALRAA